MTTANMQTCVITSNMQLWLVRMFQQENVYIKAEIAIRLNNMSTRTGRSFERYDEIDHIYVFAVVFSGFGELNVFIQLKPNNFEIIFSVRECRDISRPGLLSM